MAGFAGRLVGIPQFHISRVEKFKPPVGAKNGDCRPEVMKHLLVVFDMTGKLGSNLFRFSTVEGETADGAVRANGRFGQFHQAPRTGGNDVMGFGLAIPRFRGPGGKGASILRHGACGEFGKRRRFGAGHGFDRVSIRRKYIIQVQRPQAPPHRKGKGIEQFPIAVARSLSRCDLGGRQTVIAQPEDREVIAVFLANHASAQGVTLFQHTGHELIERFTGYDESIYRRPDTRPATKGDNLRNPLTIQGVGLIAADHPGSRL